MSRSTPPTPPSPARCFAGYATLAAALGASGTVQVRVDHPEVRKYERVTLSITVPGQWENPFDSRQVAVDAEIRSSNGAKWTVPGFFYQDFERRLDRGKNGEAESVNPLGEAAWRVRLSFPEPGEQEVTVRVRTADGVQSATPVRIRVGDADVPGMARLHPADSRYFVTDRGESLFLIGANICWGTARGTFDYDDWLTEYAKAGCNFFRVWLAPFPMTFSMNTPDSGFDRIDLGNAWKLDYVIQRAEELGLRLMLCIDSFNILRSTKGLYGFMETSPYYIDNGGPVAEPADYFTDPRMLRAYRDRLRYLVARYGCSTAVFAWEFWNEVDIIDAFDEKLVTSWHRNMARYLRSLDPWNHLISTSTASPRGRPLLDALPEMEFVQTHHYQARDMAEDLLRDWTNKKATRNRPHFHGEYGINHSGQKTGELDPRGVHLHNGLYASAVQQQAGTPMTWWWDSYVHPGKLYPTYAAFARWIEGFDFAGQGLRPIRFRVSVHGQPEKPNPLRHWGLIGRDEGLIWVQSTAFTWRKTNGGRKRPPPVPPVTLEADNIRPGNWRVQWWDTIRGEIRQTTSHTVGNGQSLVLSLPEIEWDGAFRLRRLD